MSRKHAWSLVVAIVVVAAVVAGVVILKPGKQPAGPAPLTALTPEMAKDFGALMRAPADASVFSSSQHLLPRWKAVWESAAVQSLLDLPLAQQLRTQIGRHPVYRGLQKQLETNPVLVQGMPVLEDAISTEVFVCAGPELADFAAAASSLMNSARFASLKGMKEGTGPGAMNAAMTEAFIDGVLASGDQLRVPSVLMGFRLTKPEEAKKFIDAWVPKIGPLPEGIEIKKATIAGAEFYTLELAGEDVPDDAFAAMREGLAEGGVPESKINDLLGWLKSQRLVLALGIKDDYLMVSIGKDTAMLERWGTGPSLAESRALEPLRKHHKSGLLSVSYTSAALIDVTEWTADDLTAVQDALLGAIPDGEETAEIKTRLEADLPKLVKEFSAYLADTGSTLSFSFDNQGVESYTFTETSSTLLDCSAPLSILTHRGKRPIAYAAGRGLKSPGTYDAFTRWLKVAFAYFEDFAVPTMEEEPRKEYEKAMKLARPFLKSIDETTRTNLIPSVDGTQSIVALDGRGMVDRLPDGEPMLAAMPVLRLGAVVELHDADKFKLAMKEYAAAVRRLLAGIKKDFPDADVDFELPAPEATEAAGGTLYSYRWPWLEMGADLHLCALLKGRLLVLASSSKYAEELTDPVAMPACPVTHPDRAVGAVGAFEGPPCWDALERATASVFKLLGETGAFEDRHSFQQAMVAQMHLTAVWRSLRAIRACRSTTTYRDGYLIRHMWLHVRDIEAGGKDDEQ